MHILKSKYTKALLLVIGIVYNTIQKKFSTHREAEPKIRHPVKLYN